MKKLALALVASTIAVSATQANISTGVYLGAHVGYGATTAKTSGVQAVSDGVIPAGTGTPGSTDIGASAPNIGIMTGYGWVCGCVYYGGELAYTYESTKISDTTGQTGIFTNSQFKRNGYFHAGLRGGYLFTPNTMFYLRLGLNFGRWTLNDQLNNGFSSTTPGTGNKNRISFVPGFGIETAIHRHVYLRVEYVFEFGPSVRATNVNFPLGFTNVGNVRSQSGKLGLAYKF